MNSSKAKKVVSLATAIAVAITALSILPNELFKCIGISASAEVVQNAYMDNGDGTKENPYRIENAEQLSSIRDNLNANYIQTADIDLSGYSSWKPIGNKDNPFSGTYNGNGYTISNLQITDATDDYIGLFGYAQEGNINNISLVDADIIINNAARTLAIGVVCGGMDNSIISDCSVSGDVSVNSIKRIVLGGIVGNISDSMCAKVIRCKNYANIDILVNSSLSGFSAGICGFLNPRKISAVSIIGCENFGNVSSYSNGDCFSAGISAYTSSYGGSVISISKCFNKGNITTNLCSKGYSAGITAYCDAFENDSCTLVENCYNAGSIYGRTAGGIVGRSFIGRVYNASYAAGRLVLFKNCYNVGSVSAADGLSANLRIGSFFGSNASCSVENCYYLDSTGNDSDRKTKALTSSQLRSCDALKGFDFENVWTFSDSTEYSYPVLKLCSIASDEDAIIANGKCGNNAYWKITDDGVLVISGTGELDNYTSYSDLIDINYTTAPWWNYNNFIKKIIVNNGITKISQYAFMELHHLNEIYIKDGVKTIDSANFCCNNSLTKVTIPRSVITIGEPRCWKGKVSSDITIYGYADSYAEKYAAKYKIKFVNIEEPLSDQQKEQMQNYINQHLFSSSIKFWEIFHEVSDTMTYYDNNLNTEMGHAAFIGLESAVNVVTINIDGIVRQISANAYNAILLDMYYDLIINDDSIIQYIYDDSLRNSIKKTVEPMLGFIAKTSSAGNKLVNFDEIRFEDDINRWIAGEYPDYTLCDLLEKNGLTYALNADRDDLIYELKVMGMTTEELGEIGGIVKGINTANDFMVNIKNIICASVLKDMSDSYRKLLVEILDKAQEIEGHDWEKVDLINALKYEIDYRKNYEANITWESAKAVYQAVSSTKDFSKLKNELWKKPAEELIKSSFKNGAAILSKLSAVQLGADIGWFISGSLFNLSSSTTLYYTGKAYGVLEDILIDILDETSAKLEYSSDSDNSDAIRAKYSVAEKFDYTFRMYKFVEANGCTTYSKYQKSFLPNEDDWLKGFLQHVGNSVEVILHFTHGDLDYIWDKEKIKQLRNYYALHYQRKADFIKKNLKCHGDSFDTLEGCKAYFQSVSENLKKIVDEDLKMAAVLCPVEVDVYNQDNKLVGTISNAKNTIENDANVFAYRNEELDANIIVCVSNYSIRIRGTGDGTMKILGSYYSGNDIENSAGFANVPISKDYVADFTINDDEDSLIDNNSNLSTIKVNDSDIENFDKATTLYMYWLEEDAVTVPLVSATPENDNASVFITQATSLTGTETERTANIIVIAEDGISQKDYKVIFGIKEHTHSPESDYSSDETGHWHVCIKCSEKIDFDSHTEDNGAVTLEPTETTEGVMTYKCSVCDYILRTESIPVISSEHTHNYGAEWKYDDVSHWHECSCGKRTDIALHREDSGVVTIQPTATTAGIKTYFCTMCRMVLRTETIPATGNGNMPVTPNVPAIPSGTTGSTGSSSSTTTAKPILKLKATTNKDKIILKWNEIDDAESYTVYRYEEGKYVKVKNTKKTAFTFKNLKNGKTYKFLVKYSIDGELSQSAYSGAISITTNYKPVPKAVVTENKVRLTWKPVKGAEKYAVYKIINKKAVKLIETEKTSVRIGNLSYGKEYKLVVRAFIDNQWTRMTKSDIIKVKAKTK